MTAEAKPRERAYLVDEERGLDFIADVEGRGRFSRCGDLFIEQVGKAAAAEYRVWYAVGAWAIDDSTLFGEFQGKALDGQDPGCALVERWFPGTTASGHRNNPRARWYVRARVGIRDFAEAKRVGAHLARQLL